MSKSKQSIKALIFCSWFAPLILLMIAMYLQLAQGWDACPLCILQRYGYIIVMLSMFLYWIKPFKAFLYTAFIGVIGGLGVAMYHTYTNLYPSISCGVDKVKGIVNDIPLADLMPALFKANGFCSFPYPDIFFLQIEQWSVIWFVALLVSVAILIKKHR